MVCLYPTKPIPAHKPFVCGRCHLNIINAIDLCVGEILIQSDNAMKLNFGTGRLYFCRHCAWAVKNYMEGTVLN